jgi:hypothetical protein
MKIVPMKTACRSAQGTSLSLAARLLVTLLASQPEAAEGREDIHKQRPAIGYGGPRIQLHPIMTPYHTSKGTLYQPVTIRLIIPEALDGSSGTELQRAACYAIPIVHEHLLFFLHRAQLTSLDFLGQRREVLANGLLKTVIEKVGPGLYAGLELVDDDTPPLSPTSRTLSTQCR